VGDYPYAWCRWEIDVSYQAMDYPEAER
jgi:putative transposase